MKKYVIAMLGLALFSSPSVFAAGYGDAGCGLGSLVFGDSPGAIQILAATTNATGIQSFGISSGTSNCDAEGFDISQREQETFVANNFSSLSKEMASGKGEHLAALAELIGCSPEKAPTFASIAQQNYEVIFASDQTTPRTMLKTVKERISQNPELSQSCGL